MFAYRAMVRGDQNWSRFKDKFKIIFKKVAANRKRSSFLSTKCNNISEIEEDTYKLTKASKYIAHMCFCVECSNRIKYFSHIGKIATTSSRAARWAISSPISPKLAINGTVGR